MAIDPPGIKRNPDLKAKLEAAYDAKGPDYTASTSRLDENGRATFVNRLILEASPYLLQHAHNPVDWYPWGEEALAEAVAEDLPIFLSVGYATCHWCHVMEAESFDNEVVAQILNTHYIPVKVDREQHPALDQFYITATQLELGSAGWPNSVFLLPDGRPFHTASFLPRAELMAMLQTIAQAWRGRPRDEIAAIADQIVEGVRSLVPTEIAGASPPDDEQFETAVEQLTEMHNDFEGGFSAAQQFPQESFLLFLLDHWRRTGERTSINIVGRTLDAIAAGSIHDQIGGGFHRYTLDANWRTPHFEKMLYNQGLLGRVFVEGWETTGVPVWRRAAERAFAFVLRDMTDADGAFYTAEDADSCDAKGESEEGAFYVWPQDVVRDALGSDAEYAIEALGLDEPPTLEAGPIPHLDASDPPDFDDLDPVLERLRIAREERPRPPHDTKVISGWNGLMIRALAEGAVAFEAPEYAEAAARAAEAAWSRNWTGEKLLRIWADGRALEDGVLTDYGWLGLGMLALYDATEEPKWRDRAKTLALTANELFADGKGRLKMVAEDGPIGPIYDGADGATPSGESAMLELLARLSRHLPDPELKGAAQDLRLALSGQLNETPLLRPEALIASRILDEGESTNPRVLGGGAVRAHLFGGPSASRSRLVLNIARDWHVTAHDPGQDGLVGAQLDGAEAEWPAGTERALGFSDKPLRVYEGRLEVALDPRKKAITLQLQACSDSLCQEPETTTFRLR